MACPSTTLKPLVSASGWRLALNTFYSFRGGEAGWIYAQVLRCLCHLTGATCISVYPYQLGHEKRRSHRIGRLLVLPQAGLSLGRAHLQRLVEREEQKDRRQSQLPNPSAHPKATRSRACFLRAPGSEVGTWDTFSTRNIGLLVNRHMARHFSGDSKRFRQESVRAVAHILAVNPSSWTNLEQTSFGNLAVVLASFPIYRPGRTVRNRPCGKSSEPNPSPMRCCTCTWSSGMIVCGRPCSSSVHRGSHHAARSST